MTPARPLSLVTGASAGIGAAFARALAARGHDLVLTARRIDRLETLADELRQRQACEVTVLMADLADPAAPQVLCDELAQRGLAVDWLVNNAGYGVPGSFVANDWRTHADFLQVLLTAPVELAWRLLPGMRERGHGRIVNVASLAGHVPGTAGHTLYAPDKPYTATVSYVIPHQQGHQRWQRHISTCVGLPSVRPRAMAVSRFTCNMISESTRHSPRRVSGGRCRPPAGCGIDDVFVVGY